MFHWIYSTLINTSGLSSGGRTPFYSKPRRRCDLCDFGLIWCDFMRFCVEFMLTFDWCSTDFGPVSAKSGGQWRRRCRRDLWAYPDFPLKIAEHCPQRWSFLVSWKQINRRARTASAVASSERGTRTRWQMMDFRLEIDGFWWQMMDFRLEIDGFWWQMMDLD